MNYLKINIKDNILIPYMEQDELKRIYIIIDNLCFLFYFFALFYYIIKIFDILLINIVYIHFIITLILLIIKMAAIFVYFISLTYITYLLNKNYHKGQIIQTDEDGENWSQKRKENNKLEGIEIDEKDTERNSRKNKQNEDIIIEIDNFEKGNKIVKKKNFMKKIN